MGLVWAYGVTTVPDRMSSYLPRTLESLGRAGFNHPRLFVDGDSNQQRWEGAFPGLDVTVRWPAVRVLGNWVLGMVELYLRTPTADRFVVFQDDVVTGVGVREYLETLEIPDRGYVNLISYPNAPDPRAWGDAREGTLVKSRQKHRGAHGLMFTRDGLRVLFGNSTFFDRPREATGWKGIDGGIGRAMNAAGWAEYLHKPSILLTFGDVSTIRHGPQNPARSFPGEGFDFRAYRKNS